MDISGQMCKVYGVELAGFEPPVLDLECSYATGDDGHGRLRDQAA
jgi:hypothetical protein